MTDYRPGEDRMVNAPQRRRSVIMPVTFILLLLCAAAATLYLRPDLAQKVTGRVEGNSASKLGEADALDSEFANLYTRYAMKPLGSSLVNSRTVRQALLPLHKEPCDKRAVFQVALALENSNAMRDAAHLLKGFGKACPESEGEINRSAELYFLLGDFEASIEQANVIARMRPDAPNLYYLRARALQGAKRYEEALEDYATFFTLARDLKTVVAEVFMRMSTSYEGLGRHCEAMMPIQMYMAVESEKRTTAALQKTLSELSKKGNCADVHASGAATLPRRSNGVIVARVEVNGVSGNFVVDTGASFVSFSRRFAERVKPDPVNSGAISLQTANGVVSATLATAKTIRLGNVSASAVPVVVMEKSVGEDVDGLLGMSFLSRFEVLLTNRALQLKARAGD